MSAGDSLVLADMVELMKGGQVSSHPMAAGAQMILAPGFDRGAGVPQTDLIASLMTDGETPTGRRTANRTVTLVVKIIGTSRANLNGAKELLLALVDQPKFSLTWTPDPQGGTPLPMVFDCFRTTGSTVTQDQNNEDNLVNYVTLVFPAHPFGRSADFTTIPFPGPSVSFTPAANPVRLDDLTTVSSSTQPTVWSQSAQHVFDSFSARWTFANSSGQTAPVYTRTLGASADLTGLTKLSFTFGMGAANYLQWRAGSVTFAATLTDGSGHTLKFGAQLQLAASNDPDFPNWNQVTLAIPPSAVFDFTHVASYSIQAWRLQHWLGFLFHDSDCYINAVTAVAAAQAPIALTRGVMFNIGAPGGTARAPMFAEWSAPAPVVALTTTVPLTTPGQGRFIPPVGVTSLALVIDGASGKGGDRTTSGFGGGGGGGAAVVHPSYPCTPGQGLDYFIGSGGTAGAIPNLATSYYAEQDTYTGNSLVTPSFTPAAGEVLVVKAIASDSIATFPAPSGGGLTWTSRVNNGPNGFSRVQIWTATVGAGGSPMTVKLGSPSWFVSYAMIVERWTGGVLAGSPAIGSGSGSGTAPNATVTTVGSLSAVSYVVADHNGASGATRTYRTSSIEEAYNLVSGTYTGYWAIQGALSAGAQAIGMTAPASQQWSAAGIEIQAAVTGGLTDGQATTFDGLGPAAAFLAAGGKSVPLNTTTGALGGTVAACNVPSGASAFRGGNGFTATTTGGGGGSGAGTAAAGTDATSQAGAVAPTGGGNAGPGGNAGGNNPGGAGSQPGGASGGAASTGGASAAPAGSAGKITVTYATPISPFKVLLAHAPSYGAPPTLNPLMPVGAGQDPPDGRQYAIASPIAGLNARFKGTYTIYAFASTVATPTTSRTVTVTFTQTDYPGGPSTAASIARTLTPNSEVPAIANGVINLGEITLPVRDIADDQTAAATTVGITSTNGSDRFLDVVAVDVAGQVLLVNVRSGSGYPIYFADAPDLDKDWGRVLGTAFDRPQAVSILDAVDALSGGPLVIDPTGPGWLLAYSPDGGAPSLTVGFWARWREARLTF